jgi:hypothetical protein
MITTMAFTLLGVSIVGLVGLVILDCKRHGGSR